MKRKLISIFITACMLFSSATNIVFAENEQMYAEIVYNGESMDSRITYPDGEDNNVDKLLHSFSKTYAYIDDNWNTLVDLQWFMDAIDGEMTRDGDKITLKKGGDVVEMDNTGIVRKLMADGETKTPVYGSPTIVKGKISYNEQLAVLSSIQPEKERDALYYPVRPLAESFGCKVSYTPASDNERPVVTLFNAGAYVDELAENAPNLYKLLNIKTPLAGLSDSVYSITLDITPANSETVKSAINMTLNAKQKDNAAAVSGKFDIDIQSISDWLSAGEYTIPKLDDVTIDLMADGKTLYVKTNLFEKLYETDKTNPYFDLLENLLDNEQWLKLDIDDLMEYMGIEDITGNIISGDFSKYASGELTGEEYLKSALDDMYDTYADFGSSSIAADMLQTIMQTYRAMDKYIVVTDTDNGGYTVKIDMTTDDIADMVREITSSLTYTDYETLDAEQEQLLLEEEIKQVKDMMNFNVHMNASYSPDGANTDLDMTLGLNLGDDIGSGTLIIKGTQKSQITDDFDMPNAPSRAIDLNTIIKMINDM